MNRIRTRAQALSWIRKRPAASLLLACGADSVWKWIAAWQFDHTADTSLIRAVEALRKKADTHE